MLHFRLIDSQFLPHVGCDFEINIKKGEALIVHGENGIGKTSLLRMIHSTHSFDHVFVEQLALDFFYDRRLDKIKKILMGSLPANSHQKFLGLWKDFELDKKEDRELSQLSGGEAQSLKLIAGLALDHELYLLDEPTHFLDVNRKKILASFLRKLLDEGKSLIIVEHDLTWVPENWIKLKMIEVAGQIRLEGK
jgi:ABC-type Mn2+/Zn2+ transport system ATPase subunit